MTGVASAHVVSPSPAPRWPIPAALALVVAVALALRLLGLNYSLWNDEIASTQFAGVPVHLLWSDWMVRETNPPLYYTLLHGWIAVAGGGDATLRLLSILIGIVAILLVFALGRRVGGGWMGILAAALVATSAQNILYSQQVRAYVLAYAGGAAAILGAIGFLDAVRGPDDAGARWRASVLYLTGAAIAVYSHTTLILLPALTGAYVLARLILVPPRQWRPAAEWIAVNIGLLLLWAWWARITLWQAQTRATIGWMDKPSLPYAVRMTLESYLPWQIGSAQYGIAALAVLAAAAGTWRWRTQPDRLLLPFLAVGLPVLLYLLSLKVPMFLDRTVYWASAPFLVTVAAGITGLRVRWMAYAAAAVAIGASVAGWLVWFPQREIEPWRAIVAAIERQRPGALVIVDGKGPALALQRYCRRPACTLSIVGLASPTTDAWASGFPVSGMVGEETQAALLERHSALVAVRWMGQDPIAAPPAGAQSLPLALPPVHAGNIAATIWIMPR